MASEASTTVIVTVAVFTAMALLRTRRACRFPSVAKIEAVYVYPVKGMRGMAKSAVELTSRGLADDRLFMVVSAPPSRLHDATGEPVYSYVTQRNVPKLATVQAEILDGSTLVLRDENGESFKVSNWIDPAKSRCWSHLWGIDVPNSVDQGEAVAAWLSVRLGDLKNGSTYRLVYMSETDRSVREVRLPKSLPPLPYQPVVSFADGYPILVTTVESLERVNARILEMGDEPVPMSRFRPNIVLSGAAPFVLDDAGEPGRNPPCRIRFRCKGTAVLVAPCDRCKVTTLDQSSGESNGSGQPLKALTTFRRIRQDLSVWFGGNAIVEQCTSDFPARSRVGEEVALQWLANGEDWRQAQVSII